MSLQVRLFEPFDAESWDAYVFQHPCGTPFHLTAWKNCIEETFGFRPYYLAAVAGDRIHGLLPLFLVRNPLSGVALISSPFAVYGGALFDSPEAAAALREELSRLGHRLAVQYVELRNAYLEQVLGFSPVDRYVTFTQTISPNSEAILAGIPRKTRYMVRKALRHPFILEPAQSLDAFFALYTANLRRLGTPAFPRRHFINLLKFFGRSADVRELRLDGKPVAAVLTLYFRDQILPYYGASDPAYNDFAPNNYMYFDLMRWGGANGYTLFDFGRSKRKGSGSYEFKAHWGMQERVLPYEMLLVRRKSLPHFSPTNPRFAPAIQLWRRLPLPVTRWLGPWLIRWFP